MPLHPSRLLLLAACGALLAADAPKAKPAEPTVFLTAEAAGTAFLLQGEFAATGQGAATWRRAAACGQLSMGCSAYGATLWCA